MPVLQKGTPQYRPPKALNWDWNNFRGGLNTLLRPTELSANELSQADNLMLIGKGVPTKRYGTANYFMAGATGSTRLVKGVQFKDGTNELLAITDWGMLTKKNGGQLHHRYGSFLCFWVQRSSHHAPEQCLLR
jgi:hypothetical protein